MLPYRRTTLLRTTFLGFDSVQGVLEAAEWYPTGRVQISFSTDAGTPGRAVVDCINQLTAEGYVIATWQPRDATTQQLETLALTVKGHEHLAALRTRTVWGRIKAHSADFVAIVITAIVTALITLWITG